MASLGFRDYAIIENGDNPNTLGLQPPSPNAGMVISTSGKEIWMWDNTLSAPAWVKIGKQKIEVPTTAFSDATNPTMDELKAWVDNTDNVTELQRINSELYMIEQLQSLNVTVNPSDFNQNTIPTFRFGTAFGTPSNATGLIINGTTFNFTAPVPLVDGGGVNVLVNATLETEIVTAITTNTGLASVTSSVLFFNGTDTLSVSIGVEPGAETTDQSFSIVIDDGTNTSNISFTYVPSSTTTTLISPGSTINEPDYVWELINYDPSTNADGITELFRRTNNGSVWYVNPRITTDRVAFAQKGNPDRPLRTIADVNSYAGIVANDTIVFMEGEHAFGNTLLNYGDITYKFEGTHTNTSQTIRNTNDNTFVNVYGTSVPPMLFNATGLTIHCDANVVDEINLNSGSGTIYAKANRMASNIALVASEGGGVASLDNSWEIVTDFNKKEFTNFFGSAAWGAGPTNARLTCNTFIPQQAFGDNVPQYYWGKGSEDGINVKIKVNHSRFTYSPSGGWCFVGSNSGGGVNTTLSNSKIVLDLDEVIMNNVSGSNQTGLLLLGDSAGHLQTITNSTIEVNVGSGTLGTSLIGSVGQATLVNSTIIFRGNFNITETIDPGANLNMDANSRIIIEGNITTAQNHLFLNTNATSAGTIVVRNNSNLQAVKEVISVANDTIKLYNSILVNDTSVDCIAGSGAIINKGSATNVTANASATITGGEPLYRDNTITL